MNEIDRLEDCLISLLSAKPEELAALRERLHVANTIATLRQELDLATKHNEQLRRSYDHVRGLDTGDRP